MSIVVQNSYLMLNISFQDRDDVQYLIDETCIIALEHIIVNNYRQVVYKDHCYEVGDFVYAAYKY